MGIKKVYGTILFVFLAALFCAWETSGAQTTSDSAMDFVGVPDSGFKVEGPGLSGVQRPAPMVLTDLNQASCYGQPGGFVIIETDPKILEKRLDEIDLTNSEMADPSTRTENLLFPPNKMVNGDLYSDGTNLTVTLRLVDSHGNMLLNKSGSGPVDKTFDIIDKVAKELADAMCKNKSVPTNRWAGTITYEKTYQNESKSKMPYVLGDGIDVTSKMYSFIRVNTRIGWTGPPQARIIAKDLLSSEDIGTGRINCGKTKGSKSTAFNKKSSVEKKGGEDVDASVSVMIGKSQYEISIDILKDIKVTVTITESSHHDGGCAEPKDNNPAPLVRTESTHIYLPRIARDLPLKNSNELHGSVKMADGGTFTWNLTRTPMKK